QKMLVLPVSFLKGALRYKGYSVMLHERPYLAAGPAWSKTCIFCHNTAPYFSSLFGALLGRGARKYQGAVVDALLPPDRAWKYEVADAGALEAAIAEELAFLKSTASPRLANAIEVTRERFGG